jgi:hypothetical protein
MTKISGATGASAIADDARQMLNKKSGARGAASSIKIQE